MPPAKSKHTFESSNSSPVDISLRLAHMKFKLGKLDGDGCKMMKTKLLWDTFIYIQFVIESIGHCAV